MNNFIIITTWGESLGIAWHLQRAGKTVIVGIVNDLAVAGMKHEGTESEKRRHEMYKGVLDTRPAEALVEQMQKWPDKDKWFVLFDTNNQWKLADQLKDFPYGMFPTRLDYQLEADRDTAKAYVKTHYPALKTAEVEEFKSIDDALLFLDDSEEFWALKGNDTDAKTVVPATKDLENAKEELRDALEQGRQAYERKGMILERQIRDGIEVCCEGIFWNGKLVVTTIDIEHKYLGAGNTGYQVGCGGNLIMDIPMDCELVKMALPEAAHKIAKRHRGFYVIDANIILKDGDAYFLEYCTRPGYDALVTEMEMAEGAANFFDRLIEGENPFVYTYGVGIRGFNLKVDDKGLAKSGTRMRWAPEAESHLYPFALNKTDGSYHDGAYMADCVVFTGASDDAEYAAIKAYEVASQFSYDGLYYRPKHDWTSRDYSNNISDRLEGVQNLISAPSG